MIKIEAVGHIHETVICATFRLTHSTTIVYLPAHPVSTQSTPSSTQSTPPQQQHSPQYAPACVSIGQQTCAATVVRKAKRSALSRAITRSLAHRSHAGTTSRACGRGCNATTPARCILRWLSGQQDVADVGCSAHQIAEDGEIAVDVVSEEVYRRRLPHRREAPPQKRTLADRVPQLRVRVPAHAACSQTPEGKASPRAPIPPA